MGNHDGCDAVVMALTCEEFHDFAAASTVQGRGRFIHEKEFRPGDKCPRDAYALAFPAGELARTVARTVGHADGFQQGHRVEGLCPAGEPVDLFQIQDPSRGATTRLRCGPTPNEVNR